MSKEGDTKVKHCEKCQKETTWLYYDSMFGKDIWECKDCGSRYYE